MKLPRHEFKKLQQHWYDILAELGFKDIEKDEYSLAQTAAGPYRNEDEFSREDKEEYFRCLAQAVNDENVRFRNEVHRYILTRRAEGAQAKTIVRELIVIGTPRNRDSVRFIIRRYEMAWGIRTYEPRQLNMRRKA